MEYTRAGTNITDYWPDDTDKSFYIHNSATMSEIMDIAKSKFGPEIALDSLRVIPEYIQTHCLGYDRYDPGDYDTFLCVSLQTS